MKSTIPIIALLISALALPAFSQTPPRKSWPHSCFVYKDMNFSGVFDMGDKPYSGLRIEVTRPDGSKIKRKSNIDGFANFNASLGDKEADIFEPGKHNIRAVYPDGWQSLSSYDRQEMHFEINLDVGGSMIPKATCRPIGVAPILTVEGFLQPEKGKTVDGHVVTAVSRDGMPDISLSIARDGTFTGIGTRGKWRLEIHDALGDLVYSRDFEIEYGAIIFSDIDLSRDIVPELEQVYETVDFDDLLIANPLFELPSGYGGLNWLNWIAVHNRYYEGSGYVNSTVSSEFAAYISSGVPGPVWSDGPFDFKGTYIGVAWSRGEEGEVLVRAWRGEDLVHFDRLKLTNNGSVFFDANYEDITKLEFSHENYERIVFDNFQYKLQTR